MDMISWIVEKITSDSVFRMNLKGHYDYIGVISCLEKIATLKGDTQVNLSGTINAVTCGEYVYIVDNDKDELKLVRTKKERGKMWIFFKGHDRRHR